MDRPTIVEIDLSALRHNLKESRDLVGGTTDILAMVKADAYGHGAVPVSRELEAAGAALLGVATAEEGIELRQAGITLPVLILGGIYPGESEKYLRHRLTPVLFDLDTARELENASRKPGRTWAVHHKIDTGMSRWGFSWKDWGAALSSGKRCKYCDMAMPRLARVCAHCQRDQRWYLNYFRRGDILLMIFILVSFVLVYFSYENLRESREERSKAGEAFRRTLSAEDIVQKAQQELEKLKLSGEEGRKEVDRITNLVKEAEGKLSAVETLTKEARQKADRLQYYDIALYNATGNKPAKVPAMPLVATPINDWSEMFVIRSKGKIDFDWGKRCHPGAYCSSAHLSHNSHR